MAGRMLAWIVWLALANAAPPRQDHVAAAQTARATWSPWAEEREAAGSAYEALAAADSRVLLWHSKRASASKLVRATEKTVRFFDALLPPRPSADPGAVEPRAAVLLELDGADALASVTAWLGAHFPHLAGWAAAGGSGLGFVLEDPLAAAWLAQAPELEEWNPENELVNRLAQLLLLERDGRMPQWLAQGLAWYVELGVCRDVYCFPFRAGFVGKKEHKGWGRALAALIAERGEAGFGMDELAGWARGTYDEERAALAWGAATMLAGSYPGELAAVLSGLATIRDRDGRTLHADGSWEWTSGYEIPAESQRAVLDQALGVDFLAELARFARLGHGYRPPHR